MISEMDIEKLETIVPTIEKGDRFIEKLREKLPRNDNASITGGIELAFGVIIILIGMYSVGIGIYFYMIVSSGIFARIGSSGPNYFLPIIVGTLMIMVGIISISFGRKNGPMHPGEKEL